MNKITPTFNYEERPNQLKEEIIESLNKEEINDLLIDFNFNAYFEELTLEEAELC